MSTLITIAGGSSDLTIGTTPITLGTVGRILFQGTGNVLQQSTNLFWDNTNNRLGVGTSTPSSIIHSEGSVTASSGIARGNYLNNTLVAAANNNLLIALDIQPTFTNSGFSGVSNIGIRVNGEFLVSNGKAFTTTSGAAANTGGFASGQFFATGTNLSSGNVTLQTFYAGVGYSTPFLINPSGGNVIIGSSTNAGFKLDVNGTARVSSTINGRALLTNTSSSTDYAILLNGINTTDTTTRYLINLGALSATGAGFGAQGITGSVSNYGVGTFITNNQNSSIGHVVNASSGTLAVPGFSVRTNGQGTGGSIGYTWMVGNNQYFFHSVFNDGTYANLKLYNRTGDIYYVRDRDTTNITFGANTYYASAQLAIDSTTKGFLPPRMTTAQKNAIASPAAGLVVYDTTLNKLCVYTTAWETITSV